LGKLSNPSPSSLGLIERDRTVTAERFARISSDTGRTKRCHPQRNRLDLRRGSICPGRDLLIRINNREFSTTTGQRVRIFDSNRHFP
jgi:hypothetical protein